MSNYTDLRKPSRAKNKGRQSELHTELIEHQGGTSRLFWRFGETHMAAPEEFGVFHESVLGQLFVEQLVHFRFQTVPQLEKKTMIS